MPMSMPNPAPASNGRLRPRHTPLGAVARSAAALALLTVATMSLASPASAQRYYMRQTLPGADTRSATPAPPPPAPFECGALRNNTRYNVGVVPAGESHAQVYLGAWWDTPAGFESAIAACRATPTVNGFKTRRCHVNQHMQRLSVFATNETDGSTNLDDAATHHYATCSGG